MRTYRNILTTVIFPTLFLLQISLIFVMPGVVVEAGTVSTPCLPSATSLCNPLGSELNEPGKIPLLIGNVIKGLFGVIGTIALVMFIFGGFLWMTAFGEESKIKKGWDTMIWAGMGLAVIFGSYVAVDFILKAILGS